jgi:hypothetical protein
MRGEIIQKLNLEDRKVFRRWLCIYAVYGAMFLTGLIALALNVLGDKSEATDQHATITNYSPQSRPLFHQPLGPRQNGRAYHGYTFASEFLPHNFGAAADADDALRTVPLLDHPRAARLGRRRANIIKLGATQIYIAQ